MGQEGLFDFKSDTFDFKSDTFNFKPDTFDFKSDTLPKQFYTGAFVTLI